jgi:hypothetical protein
MSGRVPAAAGDGYEWLGQQSRGLNMSAPSQDDLTRLRAIAEQGRNVPLLGGWHLILWAGATVLGLLINWAVVRHVLPWPAYALGISWFGLVFAAWGGSFLIDRFQAGRPGAFSVGNRIERAAWIAAGAFLFILALALLVRAVLSGDPGAWSLFAVMTPVSFGVYAIAFYASAGGGGTARPYAILSLVFAAATAVMIGSPEQYLVAAAGVALVLIPPGLGHLAAVRRAD